MHQELGQKAVERMGVGSNGIISATNPEEVSFWFFYYAHYSLVFVSFPNCSQIIGGLLRLFQHELPLHLLKGEELGIKIYVFSDIYQRRFGLTPRLITPADLRLLPYPQSRGDFKICC